MFEDYSETELLAIFQSFCKPYEMTLSTDAEEAVKAYLHWLVFHKSENFANGREMRNLFEAALAKQNNRLAALSELTDEELNEIRAEDFPSYVFAL